MICFVLICFVLLVILGFGFFFLLGAPHCAFSGVIFCLDFGPSFFLFFSLAGFFSFIYLSILSREGWWHVTSYNNTWVVLGSFLLLWRAFSSISWKKKIKIILVLVPNSTHKRNQEFGLQVWFLKQTHLGFWVLWSWLWLFVVNVYQTLFNYF
jgi:hypothetical protein